MKEKDLPIDRSRHAIYTKKAKQCVQKLLRRYYDEKAASELWEKIQLQYAEFLKDEPALGGVKMTVSIYDPILIFAWYVTVPDKPPLKAFSDKTIWNIFWSANNYTVPKQAPTIPSKIQFWVGDEEWSGRYRDLKRYWEHLPQIEVATIPLSMHGEHVMMHPKEFAAQALAFYEDQ